MSDKVVAIVKAKRTAIGNFLGGLSTVPAHMLASSVIKRMMSDTGIAKDMVSEVIIGHVLGAGCGQNPARQASINAGLDKSVPAWGVNQVCGSGLKAVALGYQAILCGQARVVLAGGMENMSLSPHVSYVRQGTKLGNSTNIDSMIHDGLWDAFKSYHMGITAENIAKQFNITREQQDAYALESQLKASKAAQEGWFRDEIVPVPVKQRKGEIVVDIDEFIKPTTTIESLKQLRPAFDSEGTVTAGNASGINDGAAMVMLMSLQEAEKQGLEPLAVVRGFAQSGVEPAIMGTGPISATKKALDNAGWKINDLDVIESNEAFAAQAIAVNQALNWDVARVNIGGGAISLGHPIGASGARILVTLLHHLSRTKTHKGLATLCVGGGMGVALAVERLG